MHSMSSGESSQDQEKESGCILLSSLTILAYAIVLHRN